MFINLFSCKGAVPEARTESIIASVPKAKKDGKESDDNGDGIVGSAPQPIKENGPEDITKNSNQVVTESPDQKIEANTQKDEAMVGTSLQTTEKVENQAPIGTESPPSEHVCEMVCKRPKSDVQPPSTEKQEVASEKTDNDDGDKLGSTQQIASSSEIPTTEKSPEIQATSESPKSDQSADAIVSSALGSATDNLQSEKEGHDESAPVVGDVKEDKDQLDLLGSSFHLKQKATPSSEQSNNPEMTTETQVSKSDQTEKPNIVEVTESTKVEDEVKTKTEDDKIGSVNEAGSGLKPTEDEVQSSTEGKEADIKSGVDQDAKVGAPQTVSEGESDNVEATQSETEANEAKSVENQTELGQVEQTATESNEESSTTETMKEDKIGAELETTDEEENCEAGSGEKVAESPKESPQETTDKVGISRADSLFPSLFSPNQGVHPLLSRILLGASEATGAKETKKSPLPLFSMFNQPANKPVNKGLLSGPLFNLPLVPTKKHAKRAAEDVLDIVAPKPFDPKGEDPTRPLTLLERYRALSSGEKVDRFSRVLEHMMHGVKILGHVDGFLSNRVKLLLKKMHKLVATSEERQ